MKVNKLQATNPSNKTLPKYVMVERLVEMVMFYKELESQCQPNDMNEHFNRGSKAMALQMLTEICYDTNIHKGTYWLETELLRLISKYEYAYGSVQTCTDEICNKYLSSMIIEANLPKSRNNKSVSLDINIER